MNNPFKNKIINKDIKASVVYATHSGNAELAAQAVWDGLNSSGADVELVKAEQAKVEEITKSDLIVLVCSTYDVGKLNDKMIRFNDELLKLKLPDKDIEVIGLGDSTYYDIFCGAADILEETVSKVGAKKSMETLRLDGPPHEHLKDIKNWAVELVKRF